MSEKTDAILADPAFKTAIGSEETLRSVAKRFGVSFGFVQKARTRAQNPVVDEDAPLNYSKEESSDGKISIKKDAERVIPLSEWLEDLRADGHDPADFTTSHGHSVYMQHTRAGTTKVLYANKFSAVKKTKKELAEQVDVDFTAAARFVEGFEYVPAKRDFLVDSCILQPTDEQWGKTDFAGGTSESAERVMNSYSNFVDYIKEFRPRQVLLARTGDAVENVGNTSSQRDTNDLDLPAMLVQSFKMDLAGLKMIAPHARDIINAYVPSNHGRWRVGLKGDAGDSHADFGLTVGRQIRQMQLALDVLPNVDTVFPEPHLESMTVELDTIKVGLVHGHQAGSPDKIGAWWQGQDHGRGPVWDADILMVGHFHSLRIQQSGDARWIFVGPASDPGSSWFTNLKGERAHSGMLALAIEGKRWRNQEIL